MRGRQDRFVDNNVRFQYSENRDVDDMQVELTDDQKAFVQEGSQAGHFTDEEGALREALSLWEVRERRRVEILAAVDQAEASFGCGEDRRITTSEETVQLADDMKRHGLSRLNAEQNRR